MGVRRAVWALVPCDGRLSWFSVWTGAPYCVGVEGSSSDLLSFDAPHGGGDAVLPPGGLLGGDFSGGAGSSSSE